MNKIEIKKIIKYIYKDSILKNSIYLMTTNFTTFILGFVFWVVASRFYAPDEVGITSAILSSMSLISMISSIGFPTALIFYLPKNLKNSNRMINSCLMVSTIISVIFSIIFILGLRIWEPLLITIFNKKELAIIFIFATVMTTLSGIMSGAFIAGKRSSFHMLKENLFSIAKILPLVLLVGLDSIGIFVSWGFGLMLAMIIGFILLYKTWKYYPNIIFDPIIKDMAGFSAGNYIAGVFFNLPRMILPIMIVSLISPEFAGYFFIAMTIASLLYGIPQSIGNALLAESSNGDLWSDVIKSIRLNLSILLPGILFFVIFGRVTLNLFNHNYAEHATITLIILTMTSIPLSLIGIFNTVRNAQKRVASTIKINAIMAMTTLIFSIPLMRIFDIEGAALAYFIANTIVALYIVSRIKNIKEFTIKLLKVRKDVVSV